MTNVSLFAYVADDRNGLRVIELTSPQSVPGNLGYSPAPALRLVAYYPTKGSAIQVSKGYRRERSVDESGNEIAVFGRRGARPFNREEMERMFLINGYLFTVEDNPQDNPRPASVTRANTNASSADFWLAFLTMIKVVIQTGY